MQEKNPHLFLQFKQQNSIQVHAGIAYTSITYLYRKIFRNNGWLQPKLFIQTTTDTSF